MLERLEVKGRRRTTLATYESHIRVHLVPFFGSQRLDRIGRREIEAFIRFMSRNGSSVKTTLNATGVSIFELARREGWVVANPCTLVDKPQAPPTDADIHFLEPEEVEALVRAVPDDDLGRVEGPMYLMAAMTGCARASCSGCAGATSTGRRAVCGCGAVSCTASSVLPSPSARRAACRSQTGSICCIRTLWRGDDDLVFAHPRTGKPIGRSKLLKRYKAALRAGGVREVRFHDLRHTFGTRMAAQGVPMRTLQEMMGHRDF
ncbi:MAG: site-specific integrase [Actinomycetota bacterium]|nr:site-specific integrase [Actinomycetota bacterium]